MAWSDVAWIVVVCTSANHLGLIGAVIGTFFKKRKTMPVISCPRCLTFWSVLTYGIAVSMPVSFAEGISALPRILALSFLAAYAAIWLELIMYSIDTLYNRIYETLGQYNPEEEGDEARD